MSGAGGEGDGLGALRRVFEVILAEAESRPEFARRLRAALDGAVPTAQDTDDAKPTPQRSGAEATEDFDPAEIDLLTPLRNGETDTARLMLARLTTKKQVLAVASAYALVLSPAVRRSGTLAALREALLEAAAKSAADRKAAGS